MKSKTWANVSLSLLALMPLLPLFAPWNLEPVPSFHQEWLAIIAGLLACLTAIPLLWRTDQLQMPVTVALPLVLAVYLALQAKILPQVINPHAQMAMLYLIWAAALMVLTALLRQQLGILRVAFWLAAGLALAASCAALRELVFRLHGATGNWGGMAQPNNYADLLALGGASLLYCHSTTKRFRPLFWLMAVSIVLGLSLTPSRGVWLYWIALGLLAWRYEQAWLRGLLLGFAGYLLLQGLWATGVLPAQQTAAVRLVQEIGGAPLRLHIWRVAWQLFIQSPLLGQGFGQFDWAYFNAGQHIPELSNRLEHAHNLPLHLLAELGLLPVLLLLLGMAAWLKPFFTNETDEAKKIDQPMACIRLWLLMLLAVLGIHSLLEYPLWYAQFLGVTSLVLALGEQRFWRIDLGKALKLVSAGALCFSLLAAGMHEWQYTKMELALLGAIADRSQRRMEHLVEVCQQVPDKAPLLFPYVPVIFTFASAAENFEMRAELTALVDASYRFWPTKDLSYRQALMQALNGHKPEALATLRLAITAYPQWIGHFRSELERLNPADRQKAAFLGQMLIPGVQASLPLQGRDGFLN